MLNKIGKQVDTVTDIINTYGIVDMPLGKVREFLADRFIYIDKIAFERFDSLISNKINHQTKKKNTFVKNLKN